VARGIIILRQYSCTHSVSELKAQLNDLMNGLKKTSNAVRSGLQCEYLLPCLTHYMVLYS